MSTLDRLVAWILLINGVIGLAAFATLGVASGYAQPGTPTSGIAFMAPPIALAFVAGFYSLRGRPWARWLGLLFYLVQIVGYQSPGFTLYFQCGISFRETWQLGASSLTVGYSAIGLALLSALVIADERDRSSGRVPDTPTPPTTDDPPGRA